MKLAGAYINDDKYVRLVALAEQNNRTLAGQCVHLFDRALSGDIPVNAAPDSTNLDLLAALKSVVRVADRDTVEFQAARAAIAKAEGAE